MAIKSVAKSTTIFARENEKEEGSVSWKKTALLGLFFIAMLSGCLVASNSARGSEKHPIARPPEVLSLHATDLAPVCSIADRRQTQANRSDRLFCEAIPPRSPTFTHPITVFTSYTTDNPQRLPMSKIVADNQRKYCALYGYDYRVFEENLAAPEALPYWSKIAGILRLLESPEKPEWIVWMDDDALVTNPSIQLQDFIKSHGGDNPNIHVIVTQDSRSGNSWCTDLNTGVLIVRNSRFSRKFFKSLWRKRLENFRGESYTYGDCPHQQCLHEQQAMHDLLISNSQYRQHVLIIPQRDDQGVGINVFRRFSHHDRERDMHLDYQGDPYETRFRKGDFIAQCTGLAINGRRDRGRIVNFMDRGVRSLPMPRPMFDRLESFRILPKSNLRLECVKELAAVSDRSYSQKMPEERFVRRAYRQLTVYPKKVLKKLRHFMFRK